MKYLLLAGAATICAFSTTSAQAQAADDRVDDDDDIIVTATRTETSLSKTPIAMSAFSGEDLIQSGITNPTELSDSIPNVSLVRGNGLQITIRGVTSTDGSEKGDPSAAFLVNGIYIARPQAQEVSFFDLERVEVLRGPQGTLYGRNTTAGVVNIISARPKFEFGGSVDASYESFDRINGTAAINVPLGETFAIRAAASIDRRDNYLIDTNPNDGITIDPYKDNASFRLSALFEPTDDISVLLIGDYSAVKGNPTGSVHPTNFFSNLVSGPRATFERPIYLDPDPDVARRRPGTEPQQAFRDNEDYGIMGEINWGIGPATLTYLGSYREFIRREDASVAASPFSSDTFGDYWQTSHELRLAYDGGPLQVQVGGYYFKEESFTSFFLNNLLGPNTRYGFPHDTEAENKSVFGQATYEIVPDLRLTGGVRYSHDFKSRFGGALLRIYDSVVNSRNIGTLLAEAVVAPNEASRTFSKVTWRAGIDYDSPLGLIFASVSTGYKAGGFNDGCEVGTGPAAICTQLADELYYDPETLTAYEAGFKFRFGPEFRLNGTVFHYDYKGLQLTTLRVGPGAGTTNAPASKIDGVELDAQIRPVPPLTIRLALNYLDARYTSYRPEPPVVLDGYALDRSPKWTWTAGVNYAAPISNGKLVADASIRFSSEYEITDITEYIYFFQPSYTRTDVSLTYHAPDDRFYVGVFGKNLENNLVLTEAAGGFAARATFSDPRTFGVRAGIKF